MIALPGGTCRQKRLLMRFILRVEGINDTPSLIVMIAADTDYLRLCRSIANPVIDSDQKFIKTFKKACRDHGLNPGRITEKLIPAARALGLMFSSDVTPDYYHLLGVRSRADAREIKRAFRRKAVKTHPDTNENPVGSNRQFVELSKAYKTLLDPELRHHYDVNRQHLLRWREQSGLDLPENNRPAFFLWYLFGLLFIFTLLLFILDIMAF